MRRSISGRRALAILTCAFLPLMAGCDLYTLNDSAPACSEPTPTPAPTPTTLKGTVRFGLIIDPKMYPHSPRTVFGVHDFVAWIAHLSQPLKTGLMHFEIYRNECGKEKRVYKSLHFAYAPGEHIETRGIAPALRIAYKVIHPGTYTVKYFNHGEVIASGTFILTP